MKSIEPSELAKEYQSLPEYEQAVRQLLNQISQLNRRLTLSKAEAEQLKQSVAENESALPTLAALLAAKERVTREMVRAHDEAIAWLQNELQELEKNNSLRASTGLRSVIARIPMIRRPFYQMDLALQQRDRALLERDAAIRELDALRSELLHSPDIP